MDAIPEEVYGQLIPLVRARAELGKLPHKSLRNKSHKFINYWINHRAQLCGVVRWINGLYYLKYKRSGQKILRSGELRSIGRCLARQNCSIDVAREVILREFTGYSAVELDESLSAIDWGENDATGHLIMDCLDSPGVRAEQMNVVDLQDTHGSLEQHSTLRTASRENDTLIVTTVKNVPHTIVNEDSTGNLIFTGFIPDLVEAVSNMLGFKYKMVLDQRYGIKESTGEWTGMVGQLLRGEVDIAAAALTISDERLSAIDFSHAFHHSAITCLIQKPSPFRSLEHMVECAESGKVRLTFTGGATRRFFKTTEVPLYKRILIVVEQELNTPRNADQAVQMVLEGGYVLVSEADIIDFAVKTHPTKLMRFGADFNTVLYGLATPPGSPICQKLSHAILTLHTRGAIKELRKKWWAVDAGAVVRSSTAIAGQHLQVTTVLSAPYTMLRACSEVGPDQNSRYEGFIPDILAHITEMLGVTYSIKVADFYGTCKDNKWTGMIGDVINGEADIAAAGLRITAERTQAVDFTHPLSSVGTTVVYKNPFPFSSIEEMVSAAEEGDVTLGCLWNSNIMSFFKHSTNTLYKRIWEAMVEAQDISYSLSEGIGKVLRGDHGFFLDSDIAEYVVNQQKGCDLVTIGSNLNVHYYAFAVASGSRLLGALNRAIIELRENGTIDKLRDKWWEGKNE